MQATARSERVQRRVLTLLTVFSIVFGLIAFAVRCRQALTRIWSSVVKPAFRSRMATTSGFETNHRPRGGHNVRSGGLAGGGPRWSVSATARVPSWYQVIARGQTGYMVSDYLANPGSSGNSGSATVIDTAVVFDGRLNMRSGPGTSSSVILVFQMRLRSGSLEQLERVLSGSIQRRRWLGDSGLSSISEAARAPVMPV